MIKRAFDAFYKFLLAWGEHRQQQLEKRNYRWY